MSGPQGKNALLQCIDGFIHHGWEMTPERRKRTFQALANDLFSWQQQGRPKPYWALCQAAGVNPGYTYSAYGRKRSPGDKALPVERFPALPLRERYAPLDALRAGSGWAIFETGEEGLGFSLELEPCRLAIHAAFARFALRVSPPVLRGLRSASQEGAPPRRPMLALTAPGLEATNFFAFIAAEVMARWAAPDGSAFIANPAEARAWLLAHAADEFVTILCEPERLQSLIAGGDLTLAEGSSVCVSVAPGGVIGSDFLEAAARALKLPPWAVFLQYRVPGSASQFYDPSFLRETVVEARGGRVIVPPPWCTLSTIAPLDGEGWGRVRIVDTANISTVSTLLTGDSGWSPEDRSCVIRCDPEASAARSAIPS